MLPDLLNIGPVTIKTINVFLLLGLLISGFVFWRRGREEHYREDQLFDGFMLSAIGGFVAARIAYCLMHFSDFGFSLVAWLDVITRPGGIGLVGGIFAVIILVRYSQKQRWDAFEILDMWVSAAAMGLGIVSLGMFVAGTGLGSETSWPVGLPSPAGNGMNVWPVQLISSIYFFVLYKALLWAENHYRLFDWYKNGRSVAQTGFVSAIALMAFGAFELLVVAIKPSQWVVAGFPFDALVYALLLGLGFVLLLLRSGRLISKRKRSHG